MGKLDGKVAFITGAARGQGRSHAVRLAEEGANIIAIDICEDVPSIAELYPLATMADLDETVRLVEGAGGKILARKADVRDFATLKAVVDEGVAMFGHVDICLANAGVVSLKAAWEYPEQTWKDVVDINLTGVWNTTRAVIPHMIEQGKGGVIVITSSTAGLRGYPHTAPYAAAKHGVVGLMQSLAAELAPHWIRVNTLHPTNADTPMLQNEGTYRLFMPDHPNPGRDDLEAMTKEWGVLPIPWVEAKDVSAAVLWLVSDDARYITGVQLPVDGGAILK
jgi:(+)-trans-carveol dehydrogenase/(-)-trans-carveol dehydrogenase